jgi:transcriptional regulator with XRE-family HTH domain
VSKEFNIGKKIKDLRIKKNMNAKELAHMAKISVGMLSQLENGSTQGSVETLRRIAKVLDSTLALLFTDEEELNTPSIDDNSRYVVKKADRKKISFSDPLYNCELLIPDLQGNIEFVLVRLSPNRITEEMSQHSKGGEECNYVLDGEIIVTLNNKEFVLQKGDSIRFNPETPHKIENRSPKKASYISAITPVSF